MEASQGMKTDGTRRIENERQRSEHHRVNGVPCFSNPVQSPQLPSSCDICVVLSGSTGS